MAKGQLRFKQRDLTRALRAASAAGQPVRRFVVSGVEVSGWSALFVPAKTPRDIIRKIHGDTIAALAQQAVRGKLEQGGVMVIGSTPDELNSFLGSEMDKWGQLIKEANSLRSRIAASG